MDAFVKKLVDKATKKPVGNSESLKPEDVSPLVSFHYGIPLRSCMFSFEPTQKILAISTKDGQIKLLGKDNTQALLESKEMLPSKFLEFLYNRAILLSVTTTNQIEVWDVDTKLLTCVHHLHKEITSFSVLQHSPFIYVGDVHGNVTVLKLNQESHDIEKMKYTIPLSASRGNTNEAASGNAVMHILPQPTAESKRILLVFADGFLALWDIRESKTIFSRSLLQSFGGETKKVTSASWACPFGSKIVTGYMSGDILLHNVPSPSTDPAECIDKDSPTMQNSPFSKLNLVFKSEKVPIASLKWAYGDGKATRLYVLGYSASTSSNFVQVILLNEHTESRMIKLGLQLPEPCLAMEIVSGFCSEQQGKHNKQGIILLLGESGHIYAYDDHSIEKYLLQSQSKSPPSNPSEIKIKLPFADNPSITCAKFITNNSSVLNFTDGGHLSIAKNAQLLSLETKQFEVNNFNGFSNVKNLYVTGHSDGMIMFWDASYPVFLPLFSLKEQSEHDSSSSPGAAVTAILYDSESRLLVAGDQSGMVHIYRFKPEPYPKDNSFISLTGSSKKGSQPHFIQSVKLIKVNGPVLSLTINCSAKQLAVGTEEGYISLIDMDEGTLLYQKEIASELSSGITSLQFGSCSFQGFEKNIITLTTKDSSVLALESSTGDTMGPNKVQPKKPSRALFLQILDEQGGKASLNPPDQFDNETASKQLLLLCSEKAAYIYSLKHVTQGVKKVYYKAKHHDSSCCWASTFFSSSSMGLVLLFSCGKIEIRSLPDLSLIKETKLRSFTYSPPKRSSYPDGSICSSSSGELIVARSDQEVTCISILRRKGTYRDLDTFSQVYDKSLVSLCAEFTPVSPKDKQKGMFGFLMKDLKGNRTRNGDGRYEDVRASFEELSAVFLSSNFAASTEATQNNTATEEDAELDIDDIEIEDVEEKRKGFNMMASLNKQKLTSRFHSLTGKVKGLKVKHEKAPPQEEPKQGKAGIVDQVKKKYGFQSSSSSETTSFAKLAQGKIAENLSKLQGVAQRTSEMQDDAKSFASNANDLLHAVERNKLR